MNETVISVQGLTKRYGDFEAVRGVDLDIRRGEIFAFLGPNGAGKTTTVEILEGFRTATSGTVSVLGVDPAHAGAEWRNRVGAVLQESQAEPGLTVRECLALYAGYYAQPRNIAETIALVGLEGKEDTLGEHLSGGQRRRLDVALALIGDPQLIFLDEPTTGFDPLGAPRGVERYRRSARARQNRLPDDPLHGRGRESRRSHRGHRRR
jgi:ABC-2 type transport system ATP-binding protein